MAPKRKPPRTHASAGATVPPKAPPRSATPGPSNSAAAAATATVTPPRRANATSPSRAHGAGLLLATGATPRLRKVSSSIPHFKRRGFATVALNDEMLRLWNFEKTKAFFKKRLPGKDLTKRQINSVGNFDHVDPFTSDEKITYLPFCQTFNKVHAFTRNPKEPRRKTAHPKYASLCTAYWQEAEAEASSDRAPDICTYPTIPAARAAYTITPEERSKRLSNASKEQRAIEARTSWTWMTTFVEVKTKKGAEPFICNKEGDWIPNPHKEAVHARAQMIKYVSELQLRQHRTHVFTAFVCRELVWFIRWDRAGAIVSEPSNYKEDPTFFLNFMHRVTASSTEEQGYDPTVELATQQQVAAFQAHADSLPEGWRKQYAQHALSDQVKYPIHAVQCPDVPWLDPDKEDFASESRTHTYLIGRYRSGYRSPTGRGGKCFIAYDVDRDCLVVLKDYWCADVATVHPELDTYRRLHEAGVDHVAEAIAGGDVGGDKAQATTSQELSERSLKPARRFHHRVVVRNVGRPLDTYASSVDLVDSVCEALVGHQQAWENAGILHRDVSIGNILIDVDSDRGFLNDWDLCKYREELGVTNSRASEYGRSGTWPYMSATLLDYPLKPNELADDLESFVYVISLSLLRWHNHSLLVDVASGASDSLLGQHIGVRYDAAHETKSGLVVGGAEKINGMLHANPGFSLNYGNSPQLTQLLTGLFKLGQEHYKQLNFDELQAKYGVPRRQISLSRGAEEPALRVRQSRIGSVLQQQQQQQIFTTQVAATNDKGKGKAREQDASTPDDDVFLDSPPRELRDFNSHTHILDIFAGLPEDGWLKDKAGDNFERMPYLEMVDSIGMAGQKKRRSQPGESGNGPSRKRARGAPSASASTTLETHVEVSPGKE